LGIIDRWLSGVKQTILVGHAYDRSWLTAAVLDARGFGLLLGVKQTLFAKNSDFQI
jgi:hypothetical protein